MVPYASLSYTGLEIQRKTLKVGRSTDRVVLISKAPLEIGIIMSFVLYTVDVRGRLYAIPSVSLIGTVNSAHEYISI